VQKPVEASPARTQRTRRSAAATTPSSRATSRATPAKSDEKKRPERKCKVTTKALMQLTFADDDDFGDEESR
jgi:hypothetical protein